MQRKPEKKPGSNYQNGKDIRYSDEAYARFLAYQNEWKKRAVFQVHIHINTVSEADIIQWLDERDNKTDYIKKLVRKDISRCKIEKIDPNFLAGQYKSPLPRSSKSKDGLRPTKSLIMHLNKINDADIEKWFGGIKNKQKYLFYLIREDMDYCQKAGIKPEHRIED